MPQTLKSYKRRIFFIDKQSQGKFILQFVVISLIGGAISVGIFNLLALKKINILMYSMRLPEISINHFLFHEMIIATGISLSTTIIAFIIKTKTLITKINRPLQKISESIKIIGSGKLHHRVCLRDGDQFHEFSEVFNKTASELQNKFHKIQESTDDILDVINQYNEKSDRIMVQEKINAAIASINRTLNTFTT